MDKVEVTKIVLKVGGKSIELSLDEARELKRILSDMLGASATPAVIERIIRGEPYVWPWRPAFWRDPVICKGIVTFRTNSFQAVSGTGE